MIHLLMLFVDFVVYQYYLLILYLEYLVDDQVKIMNDVMVMMVDDNDLYLNYYQDYKNLSIVDNYLKDIL